MTEDLRVQVRESVLGLVQAVDRLEDYGFRRLMPEYGQQIASRRWDVTVIPTRELDDAPYHQEVHMDLPFNSGELTFSPLASRGSSTDFGP